MVRKVASANSTVEGARRSKAGDMLLGHIGEGHVFVPRQIFSLDVYKEGEPWQTRVEIGRALRDAVPFAVHGAWKSPGHRPDPLKTIALTNRGRQKHLVPLRMARMAASPFAFLRGAAAVMAWDLSKGPATGLNVVIDGDAHFSNFGFFGSPQKDVVFDLNDFDEATIGPWEWDLKRLTASIGVMGRDNELGRKARRRAIRRCVAGYRWNMRRLQDMPILDVWYKVVVVDHLDPKLVKIAKIDKRSEAIIAKVLAKARDSDNAKLLLKVAERASNGRWRFRPDPPILTRVDDATRESVVEGLRHYLETMSPERRYMLQRYHVVDVAHRVVGVGSVGTRAYLVLLMGNGDGDPLFLQVKEAMAPVHGPYLAPLPKALQHDGKRVIFGQRVLQAVGDPLLGWTSIGGRPFYVRQMRNLKAAVDTRLVGGPSFELFAWTRGALLARSHARVGDAATISGYCSDAEEFDDALADWAEAYADQTEKDHAALVKAIRAGEIEAELITGGKT